MSEETIFEFKKLNRKNSIKLDKIVKEEIGKELKSEKQRHKKRHAEIKEINRFLTGVYNGQSTNYCNSSVMCKRLATTDFELCLPISCLDWYDYKPNYFDSYFLYYAKNYLSGKIDTIKIATKNDFSEFFIAVSFHKSPQISCYKKTAQGLFALEVI